MGKRRRKRAGFWLKGICLILLVPVFITTLMQRMRLENLIYGKEVAQEVLNTIDSVEGMEREVREHQENKKDILSGQAETQSGDSKDEDEETEMKVLQIVAQEIGIDKSAETIKAQCVIARTNLYDAMQAGTKEPESMPPDQQQELWGENFDKNYQKLKSCVEATAGETLLYNRTYIYAAYHAISSGRTRSMSELYEDADMPYLVTAECHADTTAEGYLSVFYYEKEEFLEKCRAAYPDAGLTELTQIEIVSRDAAEYVTKIKVAGETYDGEQFRHALELPSACFTITEIDDHVRIVARGMGHGFGLSQNTAEKLAKEANGKRQAIYWEDTSKAADMPDRYMITYTGVDSNGKNYISVQPNWNRFFMLQPNNMCGIATRHTLTWN
mgnify:CR=1 FL=1